MIVPNPFLLNRRKHFHQEHLVCFPRNALYFFTPLQRPTGFRFIKNQTHSNARKWRNKESCDVATATDKCSELISNLRVEQRKKINPENREKSGAQKSAPAPNSRLQNSSLCALPFLFPPPFSREIETFYRPPLNANSRAA